MVWWHGRGVSEVYPMPYRPSWGFIEPAMQPTQIRLDSILGTSVGYNYLSSASYSPLGGPASLTFGNGVVEANTYNNRAQLYSRSVTSGSNTWMNLAYNYYNGSSQNNGNVMGITDSFQSGRSATYTYDNLNRLLTAGTSGSTAYPAWGLSWSGGYDRCGNRTGQTLTAGSGPSSSITVSTSTNRITGTGYTYDSDGDLTADGMHTYFYDAENQLIQIDGTLGTCSTATACYAYGADGVRAQKVSGGGTTDYVYFGGKVIAEYDGGGAVQAEYVYAGDKLLAVPGNAVNGSFESGMGGWTPCCGGASIVTDATKAHSGSNYLQLSSSTGAETQGVDVPVSIGEVISFGGWAYRESGSSGYINWQIMTLDFALFFLRAPGRLPHSLAASSLSSPQDFRLI